MFLGTASAIPLSTPEVPHLLHEDRRPAPPPIREPALPVCGFAGGGKAETQNNQGVPISTAAGADCMGSGRSLQGILAAAGEYAAGGEAEAG